MTLRRLKTDVLDDLPEVEEHLHFLELLESQRRAYLSASAALPGPSDKGAVLSKIGELLSICDLDQDSGESAKLNDIVRRVGEIATAGEKAVVFSYRLAPLDELEERFEQLEVPTLRLDGQMSQEQRTECVDLFSRPHGPAVLLASSRVASEGLTLTQANHAFFVNRWWNPSNSDQARDRIVRIGQTRPVEIHYYVSVDTIEQRLSEVIESKRDVVDRVVDSLASGAFSSLAAPELWAIVSQ